LFTYYTSESEGETMIERWGDSQADRDAYDRWLTTEPDRGDEEALEEGSDEGDGEPADIDSDEGYDPYTGGHEDMGYDDGRDEMGDDGCFYDE
jgi:hypothetical protein